MQPKPSIEVERDAAPSVAVLMPTFNGGKYLTDQILTITNSRNVRVTIFAHDDGSTDDTVQQLRRHPGEIVIVNGPPQNGAAQNTFFLICSAPWQEFDYVALADQDDLWAVDKLERAIKTIKEKELDCYSSDVEAFWSNGQTRYIRKSHPQKKFDYFFEGGGPGNTHVYTNYAASTIKSLLEGTPRSLRDRVKFHDWFIYAACRFKGMKWEVDRFSGVRYRQHSTNVIGASIGMSAKYWRFLQLLDGSFLEQTFIIANGIGAPIPIIEPSNRFLTFLRIWRSRYEIRRKRSDSLFLSTTLLYLTVFRSGYMKYKSVCDGNS